MLSPTDPRNPRREPAPIENDEEQELSNGCSCVLIVLMLFVAGGVIGLLLIGWRALF